MLTTKYKLVELILLFFILPISLALNFHIFIKLFIGVIGFIYIIFVLLKIEKIELRTSSKINWKDFWQHTSIKFMVIAIISIAFVWLTNKDALFMVLLNKPKLWFIILFIYGFFSVYPQEIIYRVFFFKRYSTFFKSRNLLFYVNAIVFSLGHIFFRNTLVILLTFLGGLLFAFTFSKTQSTLLVSIEHAIYGSLLFTVGMGNMLGFPS